MMATASPPRTKPLVVLAGWLGCHPRNLRRYEELYENIGFTTLTRIAPPYTVVRAIFEERPAPRRIAQHNNSNEIITKLSMEDLAWGILRDVQAADCSYFLFHAFSNGGCFVWEEMRDMMLDKSLLNDSASTDSILLQNMREKLAGVVFDSCPGAELSRINEALQHCSAEERAEVMEHCGLEYLLVHQDKEIQKAVQKRSDLYLKGMREDPLSPLQLYLYSRDDRLAPAIPINDLVWHRRQRLGRDKVMCKDWDFSSHCGHLVRHRNDYITAIKTFVEICQAEHDRQTNVSKL